jgi:hypothetical protein
MSAAVVNKPLRRPAPRKCAFCGASQDDTKVTLYKFPINDEAPAAETEKPIDQMTSSGIPLLTARQQLTRCGHRSNNNRI